MATVNFLYRSNRETSNLKLRLLFTSSKPNVIEVNSKIFIEKSNWDKIKKGKRLRDAELLEIKNDIDKSTNELSQFILKRFHLSFHGDVDKKWLENQISKYYSEKELEGDEGPVENSKLLKTWIKNYIEYNKGEVAASTYRKHTSMKNNIIRFIDSQTSPIYLNDVDFEFKKKFEKYFDDEMYAINTTARMLKFVKTVCKFGEMNGNKLNIQFNSIKNRKEETQSVYLTIEEQDEIEKLTLKDEVLKITRDWLLIACNTGQRYSDFSRFEMSMIREVKGRKIIEFNQQKVKKNVAVILNEKVLKIIKRNNNQFPPVISENKMNFNLKIVGEKAKINGPTQGKIKMKTKKGQRSVFGTYEKYKFIGTHIGRYSFANNNYGKLPTAYLRRVTGHATEEAFLEYIGKTDIDLAILEDLY